MNKKMKICFIVPYAYPVITGKGSRSFVGGAEVQQFILAKEFVNKGHEVTILTDDFGQERVEKHYGITIVKYQEENKFTTLSLFKCMREVNADIYYQIFSSVLHF